MHAAYIIGIQLLAIVGSILLKRRDTIRIEARIVRMQDELTRCIRTLGKHDVRLDMAS